MENRNLNKLIISNENNYNINNYGNKSSNCCTCINSYCYNFCQCECHKVKLKQNNNIEEIDFENAPNLNINELKMKSLNDYYKNQNTNLNINNNYNNYSPSLKNLNPSKSSANLGNYNLNSNGKHLFSLKKRIENNIENIKLSYMNNARDENFLNSQKNLKINKNSNLNNYNELNFQEVASHYKTQNNFNTLKKYYQLNNNTSRNIDNLNYNNSLKSQIEFNKLLNSIKGNDNNIKNNNINSLNIKNSNISYKNFTERETRHYTKINGYNLNPMNNINNSSDNYVPEMQINSGQRHTVNYNRNNRILDNYYNDQNKTNFNDLCSNTEYNKPFRTLNIDNGNIFSLNNKNINNNTSIQIPSNSYLKNNNNNNYNNDSSRNSLIENNNNISNINQNGGNSNKQYININSSTKKLKLDDDSISYNTSSLKKSYNRLFQNLDSNSNNYSNINNISHTEPRYSNTSKITENDNVNIKLNYIDTNSSQNEIENKNELLESKDINGDNNNNFIVTFGARSNNEIKNIIASVKNDRNTQNNTNLNNYNNRDNGRGNENSDKKINDIIIDYENLKKRYAPNKLFTGLQNNINDLNENININQNLKNMTDNYSNKSTINTIKNTNNFVKYKFELYLKGDINKNKILIEENEKYKNEISILN